MLRYILFSLGVLLLLLSCRRDAEIPDPVYLVFGDYYGFCEGDCTHLYKLQGGALYKEAGLDYISVYQPAQCNYETMPEHYYTGVKVLLDSFPQQLYLEKSHVIGEPDAGDWGGYYVEVFTKGERRYWYIDTMEDNLPVYLRAYAGMLKTTIGILR